MRKMIILLLLLVASSLAGIQPSAAQNYTCPTPPVGTSDSQCASTQFVQQAGATSLNSICTTPGAFPIYLASSASWVCSTAGGAGAVGIMNGLFAVGTETNPQSQMVVSKNTATGIAASTSGITMQLIGADNANAGIEAEGYGSGAPAYGGRQASGTGASPGATQLASEMIRLNVFGHDSTGFTSARGRISIAAAETWAPTATGTYINFFTTPIGTTAFAVAMRLQASGGLSLGPAIVATDPGKGQLLLSQNVTATANFLTNGILLVGADGANAGVQVDAFAVGATNWFRRANGTAAVPSKILSGNVLGAINNAGYDGSGVYSGTQVRIGMLATEDWNDATHRGTAITFLTTPLASATQTLAMQIFGSGGVGVGAAPTDVGIGGFFATDLYSSNATFMLRTKTTLTNGAAAAAGTLTNAPAAGNPTKWISIDDNGTTRRVPAW